MKKAFHVFCALVFIIGVITGCMLLGEKDDEAEQPNGTDTTPPTITGRQTCDLDGDGYIDAVHIGFNESIKDSTVIATDFDVAGVAGEAFSSTTNGDTENDADIYITFDDGVLLSDNTPMLTYTKGTLEDLAGNLMVDDGPTVATDATGPAILSAVARDGGIILPGIDADDTVTITFSESTNQPSVDETNIDAVLALNNLHSWLDGAGGIGSAVWDSSSMLVITLSASASDPSIWGGDTITLDGATITDGTNGSVTVSFSSISGTFNGVVINQMELIYQYKDSSLSCIAGFPPYNGNFPPCGILGAHPWNHVTGTNDVYGDSDDCPHCSAYCAPASVAMIANAYGKEGNLIKQDYIYDNGKSTPPEDPGPPPEIKTHGVGMYDGSGGERQEVQDALLYALEGMPYDQHDSITPLNWMMLRDDYILMNRPVLWLDHGGWPAHQSENWPTTESRQNQGHAKVIAGYDDRGTAGETDDLCLIYDPWPEYNDKEDLLLLPANATKGPQDTFDPYWLPQSDVLGDSSDIFLVPTDPIQ